MALNIGASGIIRPYVKYNAKSDKWFVRGEGGGDLEIARQRKIDQVYLVAECNLC